MSCKIIAHRGANQYAPQNTLPAFKKAIELGADGIETDVHVTRDGELVICHNYSIDETSNGLGTISEKTFNELKSLDFGRNFSRKFKDTPLPSLDEFLQVCQSDTLKIMNIELKSPKEEGTQIVQKTIDAVKRFGLMEKLIISSFDPKLLEEAKEIDEQCKTAYLYPHTNNIVHRTLIPPISLIKKIKADAIHPHHFVVNPQIANAFHRIGVKINVWTVNDPTIAKRLLRCNVDGLITDCPSDMRELCERYSGE